MHLSDHSLDQLDEAYVQTLDEGTLRGLSLRLLEDLKEARERLRQNPNNSSRPPSSRAPWERPSAADADAITVFSDNYLDRSMPTWRNWAATRRLRAGSSARRSMLYRCFSSWPGCSGTSRWTGNIGATLPAPLAGTIRRWRGTIARCRPWGRGATRSPSQAVPGKRGRVVPPSP